MVQRGPTRKLKRWDWLIHMIKHNGYTVGAEIGIARGQNATRVLKHCPNLHLVAVDRWKEVDFQRDEFGGRSGSEWLDPVESWMQFRKVVLEYGHRMTVMKGDSVDMAKQVMNESLDFVFIDADHRYDAVKADILAWAPKVKPDGVICGHDFGSIKFPGVARAVKECIPSYQLAKIDAVWYVSKEDYV